MTTKVEIHLGEREGDDLFDDGTTAPWRDIVYVDGVRREDAFSLTGRYGEPYVLKVAGQVVEPPWVVLLYRNGTHLQTVMEAGPLPVMRLAP